LNQLHEEDTQYTLQARARNRSERFDLVNAYRLLINAYIRSSDPNKQEKTERKLNRS
jgi:hypothetical protein